MKRMTHAKAVTEELKRWRFYHGEDSIILAFCACVGLKMKGQDMDDLLKPNPPTNSMRTAPPPPAARREAGE